MMKENVKVLQKKGKAWGIILSVPYTLWINFRYLPLKQAVKVPIWVHYRTRFNANGILRICSPIRTAMIRIGFHQVPAKSSSDETMIMVNRKGMLVFEGEAHIGRGSHIYVEENAKLILGDNFAISASSAILCYKRIVFGKDIQFSWNCLVMDSDTHQIYDINKKRMNEDKPIILGNKIWIGCNCTILKGTKVPSNCVIGANSLLTGQNYEANSIIAGFPAMTIKTIGGWDL